jgi:hypothetical protein
MRDDLKRNVERDSGRASIDFWEKIFLQASCSPWLMGRTRERDGRAFRSRCLAWLLKPDNADAVVSGLYSDEAGPSLLAENQAFLRNWKAEPRPAPRQTPRQLPPEAPASYL